MDLAMVKNTSDLYDQRLILLECISGSRAYGLNLPHSDVDKRGVFYMPRISFFSLDQVQQISSDSGDDAFSELGRFFELLMKSNPTMIELLNTPEESVIHQHPHFKLLKPEIYLSKQCKDTFAGYAMTQIKKAKGLKKKIHNPIDKQRKTVLDFCFVPDRQGAIALQAFLDRNGYDQRNCGLAKLPHMNDMYGMYYGVEKGYKGIFKGELSNEVLLSSIHKKDIPVAYVSFNKSGYSSYCREYKEYWQWVDKRNDERYENTLSHGKNYDAKNMMHTFRLLHMAEEIARLGEVRVKREDRDFLLRISAGEYPYEDLLMMAEDKIEEMKTAYDNSNLPERPNVGKLNELLVSFREDLYLI